MKTVARSGWTRLTVDLLVVCGIVICAVYFIGVDEAGANVNDPIAITYDFIP